MGTHTKTKMKTIEQKTADTLLQLPEKITVCGKEYSVAKPSVATLIMASAAISKLPKMELSKENLVVDILHNAKNASAVGEVVALMIVGAKGMNTPVVRILKKIRIKRMARKVLESVTPSELQKMVYSLFAMMQVADFFALIAFLNEVNTTKATKAMETTASGQQ